MIELKAEIAKDYTWLVEAFSMEELGARARLGLWPIEVRERAAGIGDKILKLMEAYEEPTDPPPPPPDPEPNPDPILVPGEKLKRLRAPKPGATSKVHQTTSKNLMQLVRDPSKVNPGDVIEFEGDMTHGYLFDRQFPFENPLILRAKTPLGANFTVPPRVVKGGVWFDGCKFSYDRPGDQDSFGFKAESNGITITRCEFDGRDAIASRNGAIAGLQIGYCDFLGQNNTGSAVSSIYVWLPSSGNYLKGTDGPKDISIHRCFFEDRKGAGAEDHHVYFGHTKAGRNDLAMMQDVYIDYNMIGAADRRTRAFYMKRGCVLRRNACLSSKTRNFGIRHGKKSIVWANYGKASFFHFSGSLGDGGTPTDFHDIRNNEFMNSGLNLFCGSTSGAQYQAASYALSVGNKVSRIDVGVRQGPGVDEKQGGLTKGCKIYLAGKMPRSKVNLLSCDKPSIKVEDGDGGFKIPALDPLERKDVGCQAGYEGT